MAAASELLKLASRCKKGNGKLFDKSSDEDEDSDNATQHEELLQNIKYLEKDKKINRYKGPLRSEPDQQLSEFNLKSGDDGKISLDDLVGSLQNTSYHGNLKKTFESMQKMSKTVDAPLAKPTAERIQRVVAYEETSKDISKWEPIVQKNRQAEHLSFPLEPNTAVTPMSTGMLTSSFKPQTPLEIEIADILQSNSRVLERNNKELSVEEEEALKTMSLEEAIERRNELRKLRVLQSHYEQKCRRMKKIKSKKYHRIKKRAEKRAAGKETFEQLQKENPEQAKIELEKAEKLRIGERMSLKHRNTSKWAKNIITKGVKDVRARQALAEQLRISRQLTETKKNHSESEDDESSEHAVENVENIQNFGLLGDNNDNPWLLNDGKNKKQNLSNDEIEDTTDERFQKLQSITAEETGENEDIKEDESSGSEEDETFELLDKSEVEAKKRKIRSGRERKRLGKEGNGKSRARKNKESEEDKGNNSEEDKGNSGEEDEGNNSEEETLQMMDKVEEKKRKVVKGKEKKKKKEKKIEAEEKQKKSKKTKIGKRKIAEETKNENKRKKSKKSKIENSEEDERIPENNSGRDKLLMETDGTEVVGDELERNLEDEVGDDGQDVTTVVNDDNLKIGKVFQIEDNGTLLDYDNDDNDDDDDDDNDDDDDEAKLKRMTIQEAFANDDVIDEFVKEKAEVTEAAQPKNLNTSLPGWGDWGGPGVVETKRKKKSVLREKHGTPRKDKKLHHVIINEEKDNKFARNQVTAVPYPYISHEQWERSIRVPLGKHWNTASVHKKLVQPRITTLPGTIIDPIKPTKNMKRTHNKESTEERNNASGTTKTLQSCLNIHA